MKPGAFPDAGAAGGFEDSEDSFPRPSSGLGGTETTAQLMVNRVLNPATILLITNFGFAPARFCVIIRLGGGFSLHPVTQNVHACAQQIPQKKKKLPETPPKNLGAEFQSG